MKISINKHLFLAALSLWLPTGVWSQGIPMDQWTEEERQVIEMSRKQGLTLTQEQAELTIKTMRDQVARMMGQVAGMQAARRMGVPLVMPGGAPEVISAAQSGATNTVAAAPVQTEAQLAEQLAQWPAKPATFAIKERRDGFDINGQSILDAEGHIFSYAVNAVTGAATYAVKSAAGVTVKAVSAVAPHPTVTIAKGVQGRGGWDMTTTTGQRLSGDTLSVLSDGFMVGRSSAAFRYRSGEGVRNVAIPSGYLLAPLQNGDIGSTGYVLLEKEGEGPSNAGKGNSVMELFSAVKALGSMVGMGSKEDYALMEMSTGRLVSFNIPADGKTVSVLSNCKKRNWAINECKDIQSFESVYNPDGRKNNMHYFWKVRWFPTSQGPVALTQEDGVSSIYATDLRTGRKVQAFNRALGIADWDVVQNDNGVLGVKAQLAFEWQQIPDVVDLLNSAPASGKGGSETDDRVAPINPSL